MHAFVTSQLDYCNSLYIGASQTCVKCLQLVQNAAARLLKGKHKSEHITPILISLHWLPVKYRIDFKVLLFVFKGIVHFEIKIWYLSAYPKGIQDVDVFFSSVDPILMFLGQNVLVCQSYNGRYRSLSL